MKIRRYAKLPLLLAAVATLSTTLLLPASAEDLILKKGTDVELAFVSKLNSDTAKVGDTIRFKVVKDVMVDDETVIKADTPVTGKVEKVSKRSRYGVNARIQLKMNPVVTVSGKKAPLGFKTKGDAVGGRTGEAAGASVGAAAVLGPLGLAAGYFIVGKKVNAKPGDKMTVEVSDDVYVKKAAQ